MNINGVFSSWGHAGAVRNARRAATESARRQLERWEVELALKKLLKRPAPPREAPTDGLRADR